MRAGRRDKKVVIQELIETENEYGESTKYWIEYLTPWAFVSFRKGNEYFANQQVTNKNPAMIIMLYDENIQDEFRVLIDNIPYEIRSLIKDKRRNETILYCSEIS